MHLPLPARVLSKLVQAIGHVSSNTDDTFSIAAGQILEMFDVDACYFGVPDKEGMRVAGARAVDREMEKWLLGRRFNIPCAAYRDGMLVCVNDTSSDEICGDNLLRDWAGSHLCIPLSVRGERIGTMTVAARSSHTFTPEEIDLYLAVASLVAIAMQNASLYSIAERHYSEMRDQVREQTRSIRAINRFSEHINAANSRDQVMAALREGIPHVIACDAATIALIDSDNRLNVSLLQGEAAFSPSESSVYVTHTVLPDLAKTGKARVQAGRPSAEASPLVGASARSYAIAPLMAGDQMIGSVNIARNRLPHLKHSELPSLTQMAGQVAAALARIQSLERERTIAEAFQETLLPPPEFRDYKRSGLCVAGRYRAARQEEAKVGGDFYDIIEISDRFVGVAVCDVSGKGLVAAKQAAAVKYMLKAFALEQASPANALARLNNAVCQAMQEGFATLFYGVVDLENGTLTYANAGHELPVRLKNGIASDPLDVTGPALALYSDATYMDKTIRLAQKDLVLCYTDGITEARCGIDLWGYEGLVEALQVCPSPEPRIVVDHVYEKALEYTRGRLTDDIILLAISQG